jgi:hypothetical protein
MRRSLRPVMLAVFACVVTAVSTAAMAQSTADVLRRHAYAGTLAAGERELEARVAAQPADDEALAALGMARFALAIERLGQAFHRHGLQPNAEIGLGIPLLRLPVPENPNPAPIGYAELREIYRRLTVDLARAREPLSQVRADRFTIVVDLNAVRLDLDGDGRGSDVESLGAIVTALQTMRPIRRGQAVPQLGAWEVAFDRADMIWLTGYSHVIAAVADFVLAHDWRDGFLAVGHLFFPRIEGGSGIAGRSNPGPEMGGPSGSAIADLVTLVHLARWPVVEPERMGDVRRHLLSAVALSRANWDAILAETDDDREWLPSPRQRSAAVTMLEVTDERIAAWRRGLDALESLLEGRSLLGHWRLDGGIDLRRVFEEPRTFDLVLWMTGHAALPYLRDGGRPVSSATWQELQRAFGGSFLGFAAWFN